MDNSKILSIKREIMKLNAEHRVSLKKLEDLKTSLNEVDKEQSMEDSVYKDRLERERLLQMESYKSRTLEPYRQKIKDLELELGSVISEKTQKLSEITVEKFMNESSVGLEGLKAMLDDAKKSIEQVLGKRYTEQLISSFPPKYLVITEDNLNKLEDHLKNRLELMKSKSTVKNLEIDKFTQKMESLVRTSLRNQSKWVVLSVGVVAVGFTATVLAPFYITYAGYNSMRRIKSVKLFRDLLYDSHVVDSSLETLLKTETIRAKKKYNEAVNNVRTEYDARIEEINSNISSARIDLSRVSSSLDGTFKFNDSTIQESHSLKLSSFMSKKSQITEEIGMLEKHIPEIEKKIVNKRAELEASLNAYKDSYFTQTRDQNIIPSKILIEVENGEVKDVPYKPGFSFMFCTSRDSMNSFLTLWWYQVMCKMNPFAYKLYLCDTVDMGMSFSSFKGKSEIMSVYDTNGKISELLDELQGATRRRLNYAADGFDSLIEYNQKMLEIGSVIESYKLVAFLNPPKNLLTDEKLIQLMNTGHKTGIYVSILVENSKIDSDMISIMEYAQSFYNIREDEVTPLAKLAANETVYKLVGKNPPE